FVRNPDPQRAANPAQDDTIHAELRPRAAVAILGKGMMPVQAALARFLVKWRFAPVGALVLLSSSVRVARARAFRASRRTYAIYVAIAAGMATSCAEIDDPFPTPLPPNLSIAPSPAFDAHVAARELRSVQLDFDKPMDRTSVHRVVRVSFLLPVALHDLD